MPLFTSKCASCHNGVHFFGFCKDPFPKFCLQRVSGTRGRCQRSSLLGHIPGGGASGGCRILFLCGIYLDIKIPVLQDLQNLLIQKQGELDRMTRGVTTPSFFSAIIGKAWDHVFQGCLVLPRVSSSGGTPSRWTLTRQDMLNSRNKYMRFCKFMPQGLKQASGRLNQLLGDPA